MKRSSSLKLASSLDPNDPIALWTRANTEDRLALKDAEESYRRFLDAITERPIGPEDERMVAWARKRLARE